MIGTKDPQLLLDAVKDERAPELHSKLPDQLDEDVHIDVGQNLQDVPSFAFQVMYTLRLVEVSSI